MGSLKIALGGVAAITAAAIAADIWRFVRSLGAGTVGRWRNLGVADDGRGELGATATEPTIIYDVDGRVVAKFSSCMVRLEDVSDPLWQAVVAMEDRRFFEHRGIDLRGVARAVMSASRAGGGSTITQQLVKNMLLSAERTITRKVIEMLMALGLETRLSKPQILERYLNTCYWGHGVFGIAGAAAAYFRKRPSELSLSEAALLAGLLPCPEGFSPFNDSQAAKRRSALVLRCMARNGYIEEAEAEELIAQGLPASLAHDLDFDTPGSGGDDGLAGGPPSGAPYRAPYFVSEVLYQLRELCGCSAADLRGGLRIHTTLDLKLQESAEALLRRAGPGEAALVAMDPKSGAVRVLLGGRDYGASNYNRAVDARRSPGSAFKPVVFAAALEQGVISPSTIVEDTEVVYRRADPTAEWEEAPLPLDPPGAQPLSSASATTGWWWGGGAIADSSPYFLEYRPQNFSRRYRGRVTAGESLADSLNVPTVKIAHQVGSEAIVRMARRLGIKSPVPSELSLALGACEVTPLEVTAMYNTIAAGGTYSSPHLVMRVADAQGNLLYHHKITRRKALRASVASDLSRMLRRCIATGTGRVAGQGWASGRAAGKTGTSDGCRDAWFAGFTPKLTACVWVGTDDNAPLAGTGSSIAAPVWASFMKAASLSRHY